MQLTVFLSISKRVNLLPFSVTTDAGKSTVAKHLNAMLLPDKGKVYVDGDDTSDENKTYDIREKVGLVLQNPDNQLVASVVEEDVAFGPENLGIPPKEIRQRVDDALKAVDMYELP